MGVDTQISPHPALPPARALTTRVLSLNAGMVVPRVAPTHQRQGPPGALPAPPGGLQHLPDECPHQAAPSVPAPYGHLTLTRTAPGPDSSGQGCSWGGRGAGDLPLFPVLPVQGDTGGDSPSTSRWGNSQTRGSRLREREFRGARRAAPSLRVSSARLHPHIPFVHPLPAQVTLSVVHAGRWEGPTHCLWPEGSYGRLVFTGITVLAHGSLPGTLCPVSALIPGHC